jgi:hypothetical protein
MDENPEIDEIIPFEVPKKRRAKLLIFLFFRYFSETKSQEIALLACESPRQLGATG